MGVGIFLGISSCLKYVNSCLCKFNLILIDVALNSSTVPEFQKHDAITLLMGDQGC